MNVTLKPEQEQFVKTQLAQGKFTDPEAVINQALQLLQEKQREYSEYTLDELLAQQIEISEEIDWGKPEGAEFW